MKLAPLLLNATLFAVLSALCSFTVLSAQGQTVAAYMHDMGEALVPYGTISGPSCHNVEIDLAEPWGEYGMIDGEDKRHPGMPTWTIFKLNALRIFVNLAALNEDKIFNTKVWSLKTMVQYKPGQPYVGDTPMVVLWTSGLNTYFDVDEADLHKVNAIPDKDRGRVTESQMGIARVQHKAVEILFSNQEHADAFQKAIQKAIVVCKAQ